jgi:hypothetical protein
MNHRERERLAERVLLGAARALTYGQKIAAVLRELDAFYAHESWCASRQWQCDCRGAPDGILMERNSAKQDDSDA